jgi:protein required for attachment to host cells
MQTTWILTADSSRARIFEWKGRERSFSEIADFLLPEGRSTDGDLVTDVPGRFYGKGEQYQSHKAAPHTDPVQHATELFAKSLADYLDKARTENRYERLYLVAPPKFLGLIREKLSKETHKLIQKELARDISWFDAREIEEYLKNQEQ